MSKGLPTVNIAVPVDQLDSIYEAISKAEKHEHELPGGAREEQDFFEQQNPATKHMVKLVNLAYDSLVESLSKEIKEILKDD